MKNWRVRQAIAFAALTALAMMIAGCNRARVESEEDVESRAWKIVQDQLKGDPCGRPTWDTDKWFAKSAAGLAPSGMYLSASAARPGMADSACESQVPAILSDSLRVPLQDPEVVAYLDGLRLQSSLSTSKRAEFTSAINTVATELAKEPAQFAGVLFNDIALGSLKEAVNRWKTHDMKDAEMHPGSILVKPIWTAIKQGTRDNSPVYPLLDLCCAVQNALNLYLREGRDFTAFKFTDGMNADNVGCQPGIGELAQIPKDCFHYYFLPQGSKLTGPAQSAIDDVSQKVLNDRCEGSPCYLVLMGVHLMKRLGPGDPLYDEHHHWLFMTLWWTGQPNGHINELPWKYYQMHVTRELRNDDHGLPNTKRNYLFNPYLEGFQPNGAELNCITCHQFARVVKDSQYGSLTGLGVSNCFGGSVPESIGKSCNLDKKNYETCGASADFVWSLGNLNKGQGLPEPCGSAQPTYLKNNMR